MGHERVYKTLCCYFSVPQEWYLYMRFPSDRGTLQLIQENYLATGGYDKFVKLFDVSRAQVTKTFSGHTQSVSRVIFSPLGNLIISGSKDNTIKFWDVLSGLCIKTISSHLGEVTSVEMSPDGTQLLSSSKDNSNRLWDLRYLRPIRKFKGHQNTSKNFIRTSFAGSALVVGGSEVDLY